MSKRAYIGLGSNLSNASGDSTSILHQAVLALRALNQGVTAVSSLYISAPMGPQDQPDYYNAALMIETSLNPLAMLDALQQLEQDAGRVRLRHWGERTLDLDLLLMQDTQTGDLITWQDRRLTVPHPGIWLRSFVVQPLLELDATLTIGDRMLRDSPAASDAQGIRILAGPTWAA